LFAWFRTEYYVDVLLSFVQEIENHQVPTDLLAKGMHTTTFQFPLVWVISKVRAFSFHKWLLRACCSDIAQNYWQLQQSDSFKTSQVRTPFYNQQLAKDRYFA
jgi:hypothetical protein